MTEQKTKIMSDEDAQIEDFEKKLKRMIEIVENKKASGKKDTVQKVGTIEPDGMEPLKLERSRCKEQMTEDEKRNRHKEQMKEWRREHPDYNKTYRQKYYEEHRDQILAKRRAKRAEQKLQRTVTEAEQNQIEV